MNYQEFSSKIKSKYPQYSDMDDLDLAKRMVAKYPQYSDVEFDTTTAVQQQQPTTEVSQPSEQKKEYGVKQFYLRDIPGILKGSLERTAKREKLVKETPTVLGEKVEGLGLPGQVKTPVKAVAEIPETIGRIGGFIGGTVGEVPSVAMETIGSGIKNITGGKVDIDKAVGTIAKPIIQSKPIQKAISWYDNLSDAEKANFSAALDMSSLLGIKAGKVAGKAVSETGKGVERGGLGVLGGQLKISKSNASKAYGRTLDLKKQRILNDVSKYHLEPGMVPGKDNFRSMADRANKMAIERVKEADNILMAAASSPNTPTGNFVDDIILDSYDKLDEIASIGKEGQADQIINNIMTGAERRGLSGNTDVSGIVKFKRELDPDGMLFKSGPAPSESDAIDRAIRKDLYLSSVKKIEEISPDAARLNREAKELWDIHRVADDAASRTKNINPIMSMSNFFIGGPGAATAIATKSPGIAAGTAGLIGLKKYLEQGRGASAMIRAGRVLQGRGIKDIMPYLGASAPVDISRTIQNGGYR